MPRVLEKYNMKDLGSARAIKILMQENASLKNALPTAHISTTSTQLTDSAEGLPIENVKLKGQTSQNNIAYVNVGQWEQGAIDTTTGQNKLDTTAVRTSDYIRVYPNVLYSITRSVYNSYMAFRFYNQNKEYLGNQSNQLISTNLPENRMGYDASMEMTIINEDVSYMRLVDNSNDVNTVYTISTENTPSPAYPQLIHRVTGDCASKISSHNQLGIIDGDYSINNISVKVKSGIISIVGEISSNTNIFIPLITPIPINKGEKNTLTAIVTGDTYNQMAMRILTATTVNADTSFGNSYLSLRSNTTISLNSIQPETKTYNYLLVRVNTGNNYNVTIKTQLESGLSYTTYSEFQGIQNAPLSLGNIEAYEGDEIEIDFVQKAGYKKVTGARFVQNMAEYVFTGNEVFSKSNGTNNIMFYTEVLKNTIKAPATNSTVLKTYSNAFRGDYTAIDVHGQSVVGIAVTILKQVEIGLGVDSEITTITDFKTMLAQQSVKLVYPLATPDITEITDPTLLAQFETLINIKTYKQTTNIESTGSDLAPVIDFDYYQDMSTLNDRLDELEARIELLEE